MTKMMDCPACHGTGKVEVGLCQVTLNDTGEFNQQNPLSCLLPEGHLEKWHEDFVASPCGGCGAWDCHTDWCPTPEETSPWNTTIAFVVGPEYLGGGQFWAVPAGAETGLAPRAEESDAPEA